MEKQIACEQEYILSDRLQKIHSYLESTESVLEDALSVLVGYANGNTKNSANPTNHYMIISEINDKSERILEIATILSDRLK